MKHVCLFLLLFLLAGCNAGSGNSETSPVPMPIHTSAATAPSNALPADGEAMPSVVWPEPTSTPMPEPDPIATLLATMTLEEKLGQMFICAFRVDPDGKGITAVNEKSTAFIEHYGIGGVILFSENITGAEQISDYIAHMQALARIPLFIAIDEEGGRVTRTRSLDEPTIPPAAQIGQAGDTGLAYRYGADIADYLKLYGFNLDFAPDADVNANPHNPVIGDRSFSDDPVTAGKMASAFASGLTDHGIYAALKHFPGHGNTVKDSHHGIASVQSELDDMRSMELIPFQMGIDAGVPFVMVGHLSTPNVTGNYEPAIFSSFWVTDMLRNEMGFTGVAITDALDMGAVTQHYAPGEAAVKAVTAGIDILLMSESFDEAYNALLTEVTNGHITMERIDQSLTRILTAKMKFLGISS